MSSEDKATLKLQVEKELRERIEATAEKEGLSVSAWVRRTLLCHFDEQDNPKKAEAPALPPAAPMSPEAKTQAAVAVVTEAQTPVSQHACTFLNPVIPPRYSRNECQGTCHNPKQAGHPCFWASNVASNCSVYRPRIAQPRMGERRP